MNYFVILGLKEQADMKSLIVRKIQDRHGFTLDNIREKSKKRDLAYAAHLICYLLNKYTKMSTYVIGVYLHRKHGSIIHGIKRIETEMGIYPEVKKEVDTLESELNQLII